MSLEVPFLPLLGGHEAHSESHFCSSALLSQGSLAACLGTFGDPGFLILDKLIGSKEVFPFFWPFLPGDRRLTDPLDLRILPAFRSRTTGFWLSLAL